MQKNAKNQEKKQESTPKNEEKWAEPWALSLRDRLTPQRRSFGHPLLFYISKKKKKQEENEVLCWRAHTQTHFGTFFFEWKHLKCLSVCVSLLSRRLTLFTLSHFALFLFCRKEEKIEKKRKNLFFQWERGYSFISSRKDCDFPLIGWEPDLVHLKTSKLHFRYFGTDSTVFRQNSVKNSWKREI